MAILGGGGLDKQSTALNWLIGGRWLHGEAD
jgi:hypothetical protein